MKNITTFRTSATVFSTLTLIHPVDHIKYVYCIEEKQSLQKASSHTTSMALSVRMGLATPIRRSLSPCSLSSPFRTFSSQAPSSPSPSFLQSLSDPNRPIQSYLSRSRDPYFNLSVEHYMLQNSHPDSTVLFCYANDPCVVIGRNQNPWVETNLARLRRDGAGSKAVGEGEKQEQPIRLVRRRSGGGAVFHDQGNLNWSVICPPPAFDRNKHAEMVVRALRGLGVPAARVNSRHDIVVDVDDDNGGGGGGGQPQTFKVSGSAYKLTRLRSLHHGTCLLQSDNLSSISGLLRSPAEPYVKARGVESVRSKIRNVDLRPMDFYAGVREEFERMYRRSDVHEEFGEQDIDVSLYPKLPEGIVELKARHLPLRNLTRTVTNRNHSPRIGSLVRHHNSPFPRTLLKATSESDHACLMVSPRM